MLKKKTLYIPEKTWAPFLWLPAFWQYPGYPGPSQPLPLPSTFPRSSALIVKIWSLSYSDVGCEILTELKLKWTKNYAKWSEVKDYTLFQSYQVILQLLGSQRTFGKLMIQTENRPPMVVRWDKMVRVRTWLMWRHWGKWSAPFITPSKNTLFKIV